MIKSTSRLNVFSEINILNRRVLQKDLCYSVISSLSVIYTTRKGEGKRKGNKEGIRSHKTLYFSYLWGGHPWADSRKSYRAYCAPYDLMKISNFVIAFSEVSDVKSQFSHWLCYDGCDQKSTVNVFCFQRWCCCVACVNGSLWCCQYMYVCVWNDVGS